MERPDAPHSTDTESTAKPGQLSDAVFSNPIEFLTVLRDNYSRIVGPSEDSISKNDLLLCSENSSDQRLAAAAKIAYDHYDDLNAMPSDVNIQLGGNKSNTKGISRDDLTTDLDLASGHLSSETLTQALRFSAISMVLGPPAAFTLACAAVSVPEVAMVAIYSAVATPFVGGLYFEAKNELFTHDDIKADSKRAQETLAGWKEINNSTI